MPLIDVVDDERAKKFSSLFWWKGWSDATHDSCNIPPLVWIVHTEVAALRQALVAAIAGQTGELLDDTALLAGMGQRVAHEVHPAALPGGVEHLGDRRLQSLRLP
mgnify:CR=1